MCVGWSGVLSVYLNGFKFMATHMSCRVSPHSRIHMDTSIHPSTRLVGRCIYARWLTWPPCCLLVCLSVLSCLVLSCLGCGDFCANSLTHSLSHSLPVSSAFFLPSLGRVCGVVGCISTCQRATQVFVCACRFCRVRFMTRRERSCVCRSVGLSVCRSVCASVGRPVYPILLASLRGGCGVVWFVVCGTRHADHRLDCGHAS